MSEMNEIQISAQGEAGKIVLKGSFTIESARELKDVLLKAIDDYSSLQIDLSDVTDMDITFLQLLYSANMAVGSRKCREISYVGSIPYAVAEYARNIGFPNVFMKCMQ